MTSTPHLCTCSDCNPEPFDDRCRFEIALLEIRRDEEVLRPDWRERVQAALAELDRRHSALRGASVEVPGPMEWFEMLLRVARGGDLPTWEGPPLEHEEAP